MSEETKSTKQTAESCVVQSDPVPVRLDHEKKPVHSDSNSGAALGDDVIAERGNVAVDNSCDPVSGVNNASPDHCEDEEGVASYQGVNIPGDISKNTDPPLFKNQLKRLKRKAMYLEKRAEKRKMTREKQKVKVKEAREQGITLGPSRKYLKRNNMKGSTCQIKVAIDSSFDDLMSDKDISMLVKQYQRCYAANRRVSDPMQFYITSLGGRSLERMKQAGNYKSWDIHYKSESYIDVFGKDNVVYLSSESDNVMMDIDPTKTYVIGGLVDHNHHKGLCHRLAEEKGIAHAQLPIGEFLEMKTRKVLAINHVFEIILNFVNVKDWEKAFFEVLPKRKQAISKVTESDGTEHEDELQKELSGNEDTQHE